MLEEAVVDKMDAFVSQLQKHFDDLMANGREVALEVRVFDNGSGVNLESEFGVHVGRMAQKPCYGYAVFCGVVFFR